MFPVDRSPIVLPKSSLIIHADTMFSGGGGGGNFLGSRIFARGPNHSFNRRLGVLVSRGLPLGPCIHLVPFVR